MAKQHLVALFLEWVTEHVVPVVGIAGELLAVFEVDAERVAEVALKAVHLVAQVPPVGRLLARRVVARELRALVLERLRLVRVVQRW